MLGLCFARHTPRIAFRLDGRSGLNTFPWVSTKLEVHSRRWRHWTEQETRQIRALLTEKTNTQIAATLSLADRTPESIEEKARQLRLLQPLKPSGHHVWTFFSAAEDRLLQDSKRAGETWQTISLRFPKRRRQALQDRWRWLCSQAEAQHQAFTPRQWTVEDDSRLRKLADDMKKTWPDIASAMGRTLYSVKARYKKLVPAETRSYMRRPPKRPVSSAEVEKACELRAKGLTLEVIATTMGRALRTVWKMCRSNHNDFEGRHVKRWGEEESKRLLLAHENGLRKEQLYSLFPARSSNSVKNRLHKLRKAT